MDGKLDEAAWIAAPSASGFTESWPDYGKASILPTEVKVLYDDQYLYVGARMRHIPGQGPVIRRLHRRDQDSNSDWFSVFVDSLHDRRTAFDFSVNASGVQRDAVYFGDTNSDTSWDGVWESAVSVDADGWTAELKIPLSLLRIKATDGPQTWGINFMRNEQGSIRQTSFWQVPPRGEHAFVSRFPDLTGLDGLRPQARREFIPYFSAQRKFETTQTFDDRKWEGRAGLDAHFGLNSFSQIDLTARPDFGQVEVDQAVLNLSTVESYFPEKRPFFLEGAEIFRVVGPQLFYSRRIGVGLSDPVLNSGERLLDRPRASEINAAAKYTAKYENGLNVGLLGASAEAETAHVQDATGNTIKREIYPLTSFGVLRAQQLLNEKGDFLGGFASFMRQASADGRQAFVGALDGSFTTADRSNLIDFSAGKSDAGPRNGMSQAGWFAQLRERHQWKNGWTVQPVVRLVGRDFNPNDLGYFTHPDNRHAEVYLEKQWDRTWGRLRNWNWNAYVGEDHDQAGHLTHREFNTQARTDFINFWSVWAGGGLNFSAEDDRELRTFTDPVKKYLTRPRIPWGNLGFDTAGNRPWYFRGSVNRSWNEGGPSTNWNVFQIFKPAPMLEIQLSTSWVRDSGERSWLETTGSTPGPLPGQAPGTPITGLRRLAEFNQTLRVAYAFSPRFTVQLFSQWLEDNWNYRDLKAYVDDHTLIPTNTTDPRAFSFRIWNLNLIARWEFRPGSTLFFVYTHGATTSDLLNDRSSLSPYRDLSRLQHLPSDDVIQMKISWLFR